MKNKIVNLSQWQAEREAAEREKRFGKAKFFTRDNSTYESRAMFQLEMWRRGVSLHNDIDNECCPDFSCCRGIAYLANERLRELFVRDPASRKAMLESWFAELPAHQRILYDVEGQAVFRMEPKR